MLLFLYALLSWFPGAYQTSFGKFLARICEPYLEMFRKWNLSIGSMDFTIIVAVVVLKLAVGGLAVILSSF